ncbi:M-phase phosphoprotein 8 isoform X1 [Poecilia latipinna]|nr:PREDICTED: M-phase phosphoprotein 8 isoform X1 [Poecilia latipinna]XP_014900526.1 PREDICTED: M-phase phosphoprotein 8 isoform X1 [Poecilia latipinna]XP_014900528.1 PREDICTED: M-phase phosphoprotein 8 isoform X1 [Poecilia latipinna]
MASEAEKVEPTESEQDEEEDVYEVERIIDMRVEEGEVLYRVRWKNYCSDDDTWEPEAHLEDCHEVLLAFKRHQAELKAKKEAESKKPVQKLLPIKSDVFDADSESDSDKERPTEAPVKKKKKKKRIREEEEEEPPPKEKKKKKKDKRRDEPKPLPAPETDDDEEEEAPPTPPSPPKEAKVESKKRYADSDEEEEDRAPSSKKQKKEKGKDGGKHKKIKTEEGGKKKKVKKEWKVESSDDEATAPVEEDLSDGPSESQVEDSGSAEAAAKPAQKLNLEDKIKQKKGKWEVKLQGIKDLISEKKSKKPDGSLQKPKSQSSKSKEDGALQSDSSDNSSLHKKAKSKGGDGTPAAPQKAPSSSTSSSSSSSSSTAMATSKVKEEEATKEEALGQKDASGSTNLFEKFLLNCEAKDRAPRRPPPATEKSSSKPTKLIGKIEKIPKPTKESPSQKAEPERTERTKQSDVPRASQSHGFSLDSDEREEESTGKPRPADDSRERKERADEALRPSWERRSSADDRRKRRDDSEPRLFISCDENQEPPEGNDKSERGQATLSLGMDLNLDWMTLDNFQKHLNGEDEILSGPPLSPSELRDAVKSGDYMAVKLALNSKEDYNLEQEASTIDEKRSYEGERNLIEDKRNKEAAAKENIPQHMDGPQSDCRISSFQVSTNAEKLTAKKRKLRGGSNKIQSKNKLCKTSVAQKSQEEEQKISDDTNGALSTQMTLNTVNLDLTKNADKRLKQVDDGTRQKHKASKIKAAEEGNDSDEHTDGAVLENVDGLDQTLTKSDGEETAKTQCLRRRKTAEVTLPTRSSLRTCKQVAETKPIIVVKEKKEAYKKHLCVYCESYFTQIVRHLESKHAEEPDVAHAMHFPKGSKVRQTMLDQIRHKAIYEKCGEGEIATKKQLKKPAVSVRDFLPCQHCLAFYRKTDLWRHERTCKIGKAEHKSSEKTNRSNSCNSVSDLLPMSEFLTGSCKEIIQIMHQDDISRHIQLDPLICKYGNTLSVKYDHDKSQFAYIAQKMRELGRFVLAVNELDKTVKYLHEICLPSKFELAVEGVKKVSGFDPASSKFKTISLVSKIGYSLKRAAEIAFGESRMTEDSETEGELKKFIELLDTKWAECFSRKALVCSLKQETKKVDVDKSTVTEDLIKLHRFITGEEEEARKDLKDNASMSTWKKLGEATLANVCLFNRGRVGNIGRLLLKTYSQRRSEGTCILSADQVRKSTKLELELHSSFTRLELEGQYGRNMLVLLTDRMVSSIDLLVENREQAGVSKTNPYLFARTEGPSFIRGLDCFRRAAVECGVKNSEALLSSSGREQISTCWQLMSLTEQELDQVAKMLGRSSQECHSLSQNATLLEEISKELLKMDKTMPTSRSSTTKDGTRPKQLLKRRPWSEKEQMAVKRYLNEFITRMKVPGKKACNACIAAEPDLGGRSWTDVKNYVHNTLQTMRRRNNQLRSDGNKDVLSTKSSKTPDQTVKSEMEETSVCTMTTVNPDHLQESSLNCCMTMPPSANIREPSPFSQEINASYTPFCSSNTNMIHTSQPLVSNFTPLNATDTQVVPTFTPHHTTNTLVSSVYASENNHSLSMSSFYGQNTTGMLHSSVYTPLEATNSPLIPSYTHFNTPCTSMVPTYTQLNTLSAPVISAFSTLNDRSRPVMSSFSPLDHSSTPPYHTSPTRVHASAQVVPSIHEHAVSESAPAVQESAPVSSVKKRAPPGVKPQKRNKRLWSEEEQAAVRRQFGDFCQLAKVPGKKECDRCLAAEPALNTRTWREVKYFVHNSIQSLKRRGHAVASKQDRPPKPETQTSSNEWDGPVYLSL